jgi:GxxExxY protein
MIYPKESYDIIGAAMKVHGIMGPGFTEKVYQEALALEFKECDIPFQREVAIHASYKGVELEGTFVPDFICYNKIIVELKAVRELDDVHRSQAINYAKVAGYKLSILINFGDSSLEYERFPVS